LHEELVIADSNDAAKTVTLVFHARVLGMFTIFFYTDKCVFARMLSLAFII